jgi:hypothetical protein
VLTTLIISIKEIHIDGRLDLFLTVAINLSIKTIKRNQYSKNRQILLVSSKISMLV